MIYVKFTYKINKNSSQAWSNKKLNYITIKRLLNSLLNISTFKIKVKQNQVLSSKAYQSN